MGAATYDGKYSENFTLIHWILRRMCQALTGCHEQKGGVPPQDEIVEALIVIMPAHYLDKM